MDGFESASKNFAAGTLKTLNHVKNLLTVMAGGFRLAVNILEVLIRGSAFKFWPKLKGVATLSLS
jgi:hypothetical protein